MLLFSFSLYFLQSMTVHACTATWVSTEDTSGVCSNGEKLWVWKESHGDLGSTSHSQCSVNKPSNAPAEAGVSE